MDDLVSVPVIDPNAFLTMKQEAKADLTQDMNLDKAAELSAQRRALLMNPNIPDGLKTAQLKQLNRQVRTWTKKVRQPFGEGRETGPTETDVSPTQNMIQALIKTIKSPEASPAVIPKAKRRPVDDLTPMPTPPTRPAKKKAKKALGGEPSTPLTAPELTEPPSTVARTKQVAKSYLKKKSKQVAKQVAKDAAKKWLDF